MTQRYCRVCHGWHDLNEAWPRRCAGHFQSQSIGLQIVKDIEPYKAVAIDVATGKRPVVTSRSAHREFLRRNGFVEVGNEPIKERKANLDITTGHDIKRAIEQIRGRR